MPDVIVVGGGHNGLVAAATLRKAGRSVVLVEARERFGGVADLLFDGSTLSGEVAKTLGVAPDDRGDVVALGAGRTLTLNGSADDPGYATWQAWVTRVSTILASQLDQPAPDISKTAPVWPLAKTGLAVRKLGKKDMMELLRSAPSCVDDWLSEHMTDGLLKAALMAPALHGTWMGPRSPTSAASLVLRAAMQQATCSPRMLGEQLKTTAAGVGVEIVGGQAVQRIRVDEGRVTGVELANGDAIDASTVLSAVGPRKTLLDLLDPRMVPGKLAHQARVIRVRGTLAQLRLEVSGIDWPARRLRIVNDPMHLERAFDDVKFRRLPTVPPPLEVEVDGASVRVNCWSAPYELDGGWTEDARAALQDAMFDSLETALPGVRDAATVTELLTPADIEDQFGIDGGHPMHGELALDQLGPMRPSMQLSRYGTQIEGLWLGCSGVHPGGGISGRSGLLAAKAILGR